MSSNHTAWIVIIKDNGSDGPMEYYDTLRQFSSQAEAEVYAMKFGYYRPSVDVPMAVGSYNFCIVPSNGLKVGIVCVEVKPFRTASPDAPKLPNIDMDDPSVP